MPSRIFNDDEGDAVEEKTCGEKELPLPLPFPPAEVDVDADENIEENGNISDHGDYNAKPSVDEARQLDRLPPDVFAVLCCSLTVRDITSLALCSKALYVASLNQDLWRQKFQARWNYEDPTIIDWSFAYQQAYSNPHDVWIAHWNCVDPSDGLGPGRCCIQEKKQRRKTWTEKKKFPLKTANNDNDKNKYRRAYPKKDCNKHLCPSCRYHPCLQNENQNENKKSPYNVSNEEEEKRTKNAGCCGGGNASDRTSISTVAQAIQVATSLRLEESSHLLPCKGYSPNDAKHAFTKASTYHRSIDHRQYKADSLYFLNDLLFFNVHDNHDENNIDDEPFEMRDWKEHVEKMIKKQKNYSQHRRSANGREQGHNALRDCDAFEPALHSWHLAKISNPDYNRPIVWKILIQRSDCFTVFPSEGYLLPGESKVVTFGVKPFGSLLAHATHQLNVHRDGVDSFWGNLYKREAHLPCTPYLFQYHYAANIPCHLVDNNFQSAIRQRQQQQQQQQALNPPEHLNPHAILQSHSSQPQQPKSGNSPWQQCSLDQNQYVRSIFMAGHVHANYDLSEFRRKTLVPYTLPSNRMSRTEKFIRRYLPRDQQLTYSMSPVVFCSPQLMEFYPAEWRRLQALRLEEQRNNSAVASKYRTESACHECGLTWGPRMEELGQAFVLAKLEMELMYQRQRNRLLSVYRIILCLVQQHRKHRCNHNSIKSRSWMARNQHIINHLRNKVMNYRGAPWLSPKESRVLLQWEILLVILSRCTSLDQDDLVTMKYNPLGNGGVYRYPTCTDSVFNQNDSFDQNTSDLLIDSVMVVWKDEPKHLRAFSHLAYGPGRFSFPLEDHNNSQTRDKQYFLSRTRWVNDVTDTFMNDPICGLKAAISVLADPRSLLIHGLFDKIPYPGGVFRRSKLPILLKLNEGRCLEKIRNEYQTSFCPFITSRAQLAYYELQESLDIHGLLIVNSFQSQCCNTHAASQPISLRNFIQNIPPPGSGRFAFSTAECNGDQNPKQLDLKGFWFLEKNHAKVREFIFEDKLHGLSRSNSNGLRLDRHNQSQQNAPPGDGFGLQQVVGANNAILPRGPRIWNILWAFSSQLGWTVDGNQSKDSVYVDRRILIAAQCLSLTLMMLPLLVTLFSRYFQLIPALPTSYLLEGLPYDVENKMRFLTETECGFAGLLLLLLYCILCRWIERYTNRDFLRAMMEHIPIRQERRFFHKLRHEMLEWGERTWDAICPLTLQRLIFLPRQNRRNHTDLLKYVSSWRSRECKGRQSTIRAVDGRNGISEEERDKSVTLSYDCSVIKILAGTIMVIGGFSASSPHFCLNLLAVSSCSMSLGISMSLQSMETGRSGFTFKSFRSVIESLSLVTATIFGSLIGQLVGGSGGVMFLLEFVVTSISLILGGMGTISASGMTSWGTFFCLSIIAFWGYLFGRCSVIENIQKKKGGISSVMLCTSLYLVLSFLILSFAGWRWERVVDLMIQRPLVNDAFGKKIIIREYKPNQLP